MRFATAFKLAGLVVLGLVTFWTTSTIVAQTNARRAGRRSQVVDNPQEPANAVPPSIGTTIAHTVVNPKGENAVVAQDLDPQNIVEQFRQSPAGADVTLLQMDATANGRTLTVFQGVHILEKSPNASYVWSLRIYRKTGGLPGQPSKKPTEKHVLERYYFNQMFKVPENSVEMKPTFTEALELEPGTYRVRVGLHRLRPTVDLQQLTNEKMKQFGDGLGGMKTIVIAD